MSKPVSARPARLPEPLSRVFAAHLRMVSALVRKRLLQEAAYGIQFVGWFVAPFLNILPYIYQARFFAGSRAAGAQAFSRWAGTTEYVAFIAIGACMWSWAVNILWEVGFSFRDEQEEGTLEQLWLTPAPRWLLVLGNAGANSAINFCTALSVLFLIDLFFGLVLNVNWLLLLTVTALSWTCLYGLGCVYAGLVMLLRDATHVVGLGIVVLEILAGATFPLSVLPVWLRGMAKLTPLSWVLSSLRSVLIDGCSWSDLRVELTILTVMAVLVPIGGYLSFRAFEAATRKRGVLSGY